MRLGPRDAAAGAPAAAPGVSSAASAVDDRAPAARGSSVFSARWMVATRYGSPASTPCGQRRAVGPRPRRAPGSSTSVMTSPTSDASARPGPRRPGGPWRPRSAPGSRSAAWSVSTRLCSSGMRRLNERSPASRWATGRCIFTARQRAGERRVGVAVDEHPVRAGARRGPRPARPASRRSGRRGCPSRRRGGRPAPGCRRSAKKTSDMLGVVVLTGVDDDVLVRRGRRTPSRPGRA